MPIGLRQIKAEASERHPWYSARQDALGEGKHPIDNPNA